jgi:hypothetical protein
LLMRMAWKDVARIRFDCFHTGNSATEDFELASCHSLWSADSVSSRMSDSRQISANDVRNVAELRLLRGDCYSMRKIRNGRDAIVVRHREWPLPDTPPRACERPT